MNQYQVLGVVGEGELQKGVYGVVLKCRHKRSQQIIAIKKFKEDNEDEATRKTIFREVKILRMLNHQNIVQLKDAFRRKGRLYLVLEFVEKNLLEVLEENPNGIPGPLLKSYIYQLCKAIQYLHSQEILHRDIKPENLLISSQVVSREHILKLCDFGFARTIPQPVEGLTDYVATRWYRSPELLVGSDSYGKEVDIWAIGCIMGELVDGQPVFPGESEIDQLFVIQRVIGILTDQLKERFDKNPMFLGLQFPKIAKPETLQSKYKGKLESTGIDFMSKLLQMDPSKRLTAHEALMHPYFEEMRSQDANSKQIRWEFQKNQNRGHIANRSKTRASPMISDLSELETSPHRSLRELNHQRDQKKTQRKFVPKFQNSLQTLEQVYINKNIKISASLGTFMYKIPEEARAITKYRRRRSKPLDVPHMKSARKTSLGSRQYNDYYDNLPTMHKHASVKQLPSQQTNVRQRFKFITKEKRVESKLGSRQLREENSPKSKGWVTVVLPCIKMEELNPIVPEFVPITHDIFTPNFESSIIKNVWSHNFVDEIRKIALLVDEYSHIAMDTEFPGIVLKACNADEFDLEYQNIRANVNTLKLIQIGITLADDKGNFPPDTCSWQFNLKFDLETDIYAENSIDLLKESGIDFAAHQKDGIDPQVFAEYFIISGLVLNEDITWITFHGGYDFAYMLRSLQHQPLPQNKEGFYKLLSLFTPTFYDVKLLIANYDYLRGGLNKLAKEYGVQRIGQVHQAGSDSLVTAEVFFQIKESFYPDGIPEDKKSVIFGLEQ